MRKIRVIVNPASGQPKPILHTLNKVFRPLGIDWDLALTKDSGDAESFARLAAEAGADVVAAFGGDGTVMEVARGLFGTGVPLAILPGGTANLMSVELGIPKDLQKAVEVAADPESPVRMVDAGLIGQEYFLLRVGVGFDAEKVKAADRELKTKYGILAYSIGGLRALRSTKKAHYRLTLDGKVQELDGLTCLIDNAGNMGVSGFDIIPGISVSDGLLDVIIVEHPSFAALVEKTARTVRTQQAGKSYRHWQAREITVETDPPQLVQVDGEITGETPVSITVSPGLVGVITPAG
jgi:YegS/Rv2252/BmrU family lipid kinase